MCLRPNIIVNRHYLKICDSDRLRALKLYGQRPDFYIKVDCGICIECQKKRGANWRTRLLDEYSYYVKRFPDNKIHFCTLTYAPEYYERFKDNPEKSVRLFLERYRKRYGKSFRHWICSEYGEKKGRLHLHMIAFGALFDIEELRSLWSYGRVDMQTLKGPQGLTYVSGYITKVVKNGKQSKDNIPLFIPKDKKTYVWTSPRFGLAYSLDYTNRFFHTQNGKLVYLRQRDNGAPFAIPRYYMNKIFSPIDLYNRRSQYFDSLFSLPKPPFKVLNHYYDDFVSYLKKVHKLGGTPLILSTQFNLLNFDEKLIYFYG